MELALDTSTETASIALSLKGEVRAELTWYCGQNHTAELMPNLVHLLRQTKTSLQDVNGIIVAKGPGSFNGLRVGVGTAKGLAFALGVPLVGISTLEVTAFPYANTGLPVCPLLDARRGEVATALFQAKGGKWWRLWEEHITTVDTLLCGITGQTIFCGQITPEVAARLRERAKQQALVIEGAALLRRAGYLAELGWRRLEAEDFDHPATLQPLYLRRPAITTK